MRSSIVQMWDLGPRRQSGAFSVVCDPTVSNVDFIL